MKKIIWQARAKITADSFRDRRLSPMANGGNAYDYYAAEALTRAFDVEMSQASLFAEGGSLWAYWRRMQADRYVADAVICDPYPTVFGTRVPGIRYIGIIHHIDDDLSRSSVKHDWFVRFLKLRLPSLHGVVTVSKFWKKYLEDLGCRQVRIIYNSFDPVEFQVSDQEKAAFRSRYGLTADRPIVYIGNAKRQKGVYEVYEALKDKPYQLVMSGTRNQAPDLPARYMRVDGKEYLTMLAVSDVVLTFSILTEGWTRVAHEALLCGTPVVGSGIGGMRELLEGAGQHISPETSGIAAAVDDALRNREVLAKRGLEYVRQFDMEYFRSAWMRTVSELIDNQAATR